MKISGYNFYYQQEKFNKSLEQKVQDRIDIGDRYNELIKDLEYRSVPGKTTLTKEEWEEVLSDINFCETGTHGVWLISEELFIYDSEIKPATFSRYKCKDIIPIKWALDYAVRRSKDIWETSAKDQAYFTIPELISKVKEHEERIKTLERTAAEQAETIRILQQKTIGTN